VGSQQRATGEYDVRFSANLTFLFKDVPFLQRFERARRAGFEGVEFMWPSGEDLGEVESAARDSGLQVALFNFDAGNIAGGDRGLCSDPARTAAFRENVPVALELAQRLGCTRLNALVGLRLPELELDAQLELARDNVAWAATEAQPQGASILVEAVNSLENGPYLLDRSAAAMAFIESVEAANVSFQYDAYHMQRMEGDLAATIERYLPRIGHVQIADSPSRNEPGTGEINYRFLLELLQARGYDGWVGLEYNPSTPDTEGSLGWMVDFGYSLFGETEGVAHV
jgi:hydroxypyruvate isomerase